MHVNGHTRHSPLPCLHPFHSAARSRQSMRCANSFHAGSPRKPAPPTCQRAGSFQPFPPETHRFCRLRIAHLPRVRTCRAHSHRYLHPVSLGLPHIFAAPQDPHTCLHSRHSPSCVLKCAPKRQAREHKDANAPVCVPMCARSSFRRTLRDANERIRARTLEIPRLTSFISSNGIPTAIHSSSTVHSQYVVAKPQHNQAPPHEKSPQHHFLGFKGLIAALADIYLHFKGLLFVNPPYIDGDIPPLILRILADSNPSKRR